MEGLPLIVVVTWLVHQCVLNGCCVAGFRLVPETEPSPARSSQSGGQRTVDEFSQPGQVPSPLYLHRFITWLPVLSSLLGSSQSKPCDLGQSHGALVCWLIKWKYLLARSPCKASERISEVGGRMAQPLGTAEMPSAGH